MRTDRPFLAPSTVAAEAETPRCLDCRVELTCDDVDDWRCDDCYLPIAEKRAREASGRQLAAALTEPLRPWRKRLPGFDDEGPGAA